MPASSSCPVHPTDVLPEVPMGDPLPTGRNDHAGSGDAGVVPDCRDERGRRHSLQVIVVVALSVMLAGARC